MAVVIAGKHNAGAALPHTCRDTARECIVFSPK